MIIPQLKNKKILILGFGREGQSSLRFLRKYYSKQTIGVADQNMLAQFKPGERAIIKKDKNIEFYLGKNYLQNLEQFDIIIKTPGLKLEDKIINKLRKKGVKITTNLNIFLANTKGRTVGITGTKGKSTTASLIYEILKTAGKKAVLVGNIGKPFLNYLKQDTKETIFVAELSSYQLDTLDQKIEAAIITSFYPEHLNYHGNLNNYFQAKMNIIHNLKPGGVVVYNQNFRRVADFVKKQKIKSVGYSLLSLRGDPLLRADVAISSLIGEHNLQNMIGAILVARFFKVSNEIIQKALKKFQPLEHRLELVGKFKGITFYNDVLSTTPESTMEAIRALRDENLETLIVGGFDRGLDYKTLAKEIKKSKIRNMIVWPNAGRKIESELKKISAHQKIIRVKNMRDTILASFQHTSPKGTVLLSPAASSYDFYQDYREKGTEFKKLIKKYGKI